ncbi:MAG: tRNA (guanosine(46)-N7)-methyltransferase TrmB [Acidobacteriota bacterium]
MAPCVDPRPCSPSARWHVGVYLDGVAVDGDVSGIFPRVLPLEMEIGCGKGRFIIHCAEKYPGRNFLAVERARRYLNIARERARRRALPNLRLVRADADEIVQARLASGSLQAVHVLFPDPWPKKRHRKRRLFHPSFVEGIARVLADGGVLNVATDFTEYFERIDSLVSSHRCFQRRAGFALEGRLPAGESGHTNYEVKYRAAGRTIHQATWERRPRHTR